MVHIFVKMEDAAKVWPVEAISATVPKNTLENTVRQVSGLEKIVCPSEAVFATYELL